MESTGLEETRRRIARLEREIAALEAERQRSLLELGTEEARANAVGGPPGPWYGFATASQVGAVRELLARCALPFQDLTWGRQEILIAARADAIVGAAGLEMGGGAALLRSVVVEPAERGRGTGLSLCDRALAQAVRRGARVAFLLTTTAESYFRRMGFERVDRSAVPAPLQSSEEMRSLCPASAACMARSLIDRVHHYPADLLPLRADAVGSSMWAVALERAMLTHFEVEPGFRFDRHVHDSEQITFVLEGELVFETGDGRSVRVRSGEVVAVPSNVPHAVTAGERGARAVDAWAPAREEYR